MKITVCLPSRGRPAKLQASIRALQSLASGNHEITYAIGVDHDDPETIGACIPLGPVVRVHVLRRRGSLGQIVNILSEQNPADVYCSYADDLVMQEPGWDQIIADALEDHPDWVLWWGAQTVNCKTTYAIVPEVWRKAAGRIFTDYFPFWFDDTWLMQVWQYAKGVDHWVALDAEIIDDSMGKTHRLQDYQFWEQFFWDRDGERLEEAARIAWNLGWPAVLRPEQYRLERGKMFTQEQLDYRSEGSPPTPEYVAALERAKSSMRSKLTQQGEVTIDHTNSPGITPEWAASVGLTGPVVGAGKKFESGVKNCKHCGADVIMHPQRERERGWCMGCDSYICDGCGYLKKLGRPCKTLQQTLEEMFNAINKRRF